jgi:hypothetical protein
MKKQIFLVAGLLISCLMMAQMAPIYMETFDRCFDEEDENYGYTGGNDNQWGGNIATAIVVYQDAPEWTLDYCNGAYQCLKVGTKEKQGSATTPAIACEGDVVLTFRVAPWEGDSIFYVSLSGGTTTDKTYFFLKKHQWTNVTVHVTDIKSSLKITFSSTNKHRFFLDDVCVRPEDPTVGTIRVAEGANLDWGILGRHYKASPRTLHVEGANLTAAGITATLAEGEPNLFQLSATTLPAEGGELTVTCKAGASVSMHGSYLYLRGKDKNTNAQVEKRVTLVFEVTDLDLEGSGTKPDPYTCSDVILLAANEGTVFTGDFHWVTGYVLGGVKRYQNAYDGISFTDNLSLVLADKPDEIDDNRYVTVQISGNARAALNVVDNPELIGQIIKVQGNLLNDNANPWFLGKPGVLNVHTDDQYVRPDKESQAVENIQTGNTNTATKVLHDGQLLILRGSHIFDAQGKMVR